MRTSLTHWILLTALTFGLTVGNSAFAAERNLNFGGGRFGNLGGANFKAQNNFRNLNGNGGQQGFNLQNRVANNLGNNLGNRLVNNLGNKIGNNLGNKLGDNIGNRLGDKVGARIGENLGNKVGARIGDNLGNKVGARIGDNLGNKVGTRIGDKIGAKVGDKLGNKIGNNIGDKLGNRIGDKLGDKVGAKIGEKIGDKIGNKVGEKIGDKIGNKVGEKIGEKVGQKVGDKMGDRLGDKIGDRFPLPNGNRPGVDLGRAAYLAYLNGVGFPRFAGNTVVQVPVEVPVQVPVQTAAPVASASSLEAAPVEAQLPTVSVGSKLTMRNPALPAEEGAMMMQVGQLLVPMQTNRWEAGAVTFTVPMMMLAASTEAELVAVDREGVILAVQNVSLVAAEPTAAPAISLTAAE